MLTQIEKNTLKQTFKRLQYAGILLINLAFLASCTLDAGIQEYPTAKVPAQALQSFHFQDDVQPVLDRYCVACHACYDAPCQLKLESSLGLDRGASKTTVYNGKRLKAIDPTRLHQDASTTDAWREKGFYSVLFDKAPGQVPTTGLLSSMLAFGHNDPISPESDIKRLLESKYSCPGPEEFSDYAESRPQGGMPYAVTGLSGNHYDTLTTWIQQGAKFDTPDAQIDDSTLSQIEQWESYFNRTDKKSKLIARYLYEHLFLSHLYFSGEAAEPKQFFKLVRATAPAPVPIISVRAVRPNNDPGHAFYYRLQPIVDTLVHKTHITYALNEQRMARYRTLFDVIEWNTDTLPDYSNQSASNPFLTFAAIPARSRYQFMLDEAEYFTRNFIRGPVCRGQVATDVIRDQFWIAFESPDTDEFIQHADYRQAVAPLLGLPGRNSSLLDFGEQWLSYSSKRIDYMDQRDQQHRKTHPNGQTLAHLWDGDQDNDNAFLSIFRHHDSASVRRGWWGKTPRTLWVLDYPLLERTYYELVVNFNVFGNVSHQAQTRLYFDFIRHEGESNFLRFIPASKRAALFDEWYQGLAAIKEAISYHKLDTETPSAIVYPDNIDAKQALIDRVFESHGDLLSDDIYNRCEGTTCGLPLGKERRLALALEPLANANSENQPGMLRLPEVTSVRVLFEDGSDQVLQLFRNRAHSNVAFMFGEKFRYQPEEDTLSVMEYPLSSYINFQFTVEESELEHFVKMLLNMDSDEDQAALSQRWGVQRTAPDFWDQFHSHYHDMKERRPLEAGIYDLNRYLAW